MLVALAGCLGSRYLSVNLPASKNLRLQASVRFGSLIKRLDLALARTFVLLGRLGLGLRLAFAFALCRAQRWRRHAEEVGVVPPKLLWEGFD